MLFLYPMKVPIPYGSYDGFPSSYGSYGYDGLPLSYGSYDGLPLS